MTQVFNQIGTFTTRPDGTIVPDPETAKEAGPATP